LGGLSLGRRSQVVRQRSAKPLFIGSIPIAASKYNLTQSNRLAGCKDCDENRASVQKRAESVQKPRNRASLMANDQHNKQLSDTQAEVLRLLAEKNRRLFQRAEQWLIREPGYVIGTGVSDAEIQELQELGYIETGHITDTGRQALESWRAENDKF
jgi:hypothetical protein